MRKIIYLIFLFTFFAQHNLVGEDFSTEVITVSQGLPNPQVNTIYLGNRGLMWIGTTNGLCLFDGYTFTVLQSVPFDSSTFADDNVQIIQQGRLNNIWLYTSYGIEHLNVFSGETSKIKHLDINTSPIVSLLPSDKNNFMYIVGENFIDKVNISTLEISEPSISLDFKIVDAALFNDLAVLLTNKGIYHFDLDRNKVISHFSFNSIETGNVVANSKNYYFTINNDLYVYSSSLLKPQKVVSETRNIKSLTLQCGNSIAYSTENEISVLSLGENYTIKKKHRYLENSTYRINMLTQDQNCLIWAATEQGMVKINPYSLRIDHQDYTDLNISYKDLLVESGKKGILYHDEAGNTIFYNSIHNTFHHITIDDYTSVCLLDEENLLVGSEKGLYSIDLKSNSKKRIEPFSGHIVHSIRMLDDKIWISTDKGIYLNEEDGKYILQCDIEITDFIISSNELYYTHRQDFGILNTESCLMNPLLNESNSEEFLKILDLQQSFDGKIWLATDDGLYRFNPNANGGQEQIFSLVFKGKVFSIIEAPNKPEVWFASDMGIGCINYQDEKIMLLGFEDGIRNTSFIAGGTLSGQNGDLIFLGERAAISLNPDSIYRNQALPKTVVSKIQYVKNKRTYSQFFFIEDTIVIKPDIRFYQLSFSTLNYFAPQRTKFEYSLVPYSKEEEWEELSLNTLSLGNLRPGNYSLKIKATNSHGITSKESEDIYITVKAPVLQSRLAFLAYGLLLFLGIIMLIKFRTRNLMRINREYKEKERIAKKIEQQKEELTIKNKNITDSISYARRIQLAMMPSAKNFTALFPDSFILHMPKDIVSGDFYWVNKVNDKTFFSAVDCTGHGVPGAFMSIIGVELFRRITEIEKIYTPAEILNSLSNNFDRVFGDVDEMKLRDGMDLAFCALSKDNKVLEYAGAFNPLYIIRDNSIIEVKGDRHSVGVYHEDDIERSFNNHVIPVQDQDLIYIFTDGFADQFGGPEEKKYKYRRFRHLLLALHQLPMEKQEEFLKKSILEWKGSLDQVDDILVMGVRIHHQK